MSTTRRGIRIERGSKRVRVYVGGEVVADTVQPVMVWEVPYYPAYYFPVTDVRTGLLQREGGVAHSPSRGDGQQFSVKGTSRAALRYEDSPIEELRDVIRFDWNSMDAWFEEDEQVFTHPRDPYTRVDILASSRHVRVDVQGTTVAESTSPRMLFETGLPVRYYLPKTHVRMDLLSLTDSVTHCPYKGQAEYWSVRAAGTDHRDLAWSYRAPFPESQKIAGFIAFYNEKAGTSMSPACCRSGRSRSSHSPAARPRRFTTRSPTVGTAGMPRVGEKGPHHAPGTVGPQARVSLSRLRLPKDRRSGRARCHRTAGA